MTKHKKSQDFRQNWFYRFQKKDLKDKIGHCEICGDVKDLEIHHKEAFCKGGTEFEENLLVVCDKCHKQLHKKKWREK